MKLKTLKDLVNEESCTQPCPYDIGSKELRQEAIKWIKADIEKYRNQKFILEGMNGTRIHNYIVNTRQFWKDRFNITEEELKEV